MSDPKFLTEFRLVSNSFDSKFPSKILKLYRLNNIYLLHNPVISGNVPSGIGKMNFLMEIELYFTSLYGNIPSEFGLIKDLCYIGIDETHIHGPIPDKMGNMHQIKYLYIELL